jgi:hypothetical protein
VARGRARYQRGRVVATKGGGWEIHYDIYLTDPATGKPKPHHRSPVVGYKPKMHRAGAEKILAAELAAINGGPITERQTEPSHLAIGCGISIFRCAAPTGVRRPAAPRLPQQPRLCDPRTCRAQRHQQVSGADAAQQTGCGRILLHGCLSWARSDQSCIGRGGGPGCSSWNEMSRARPSFQRSRSRTSRFFPSKCMPSCWPVLTASVTAPSS